MREAVQVLFEKGMKVSARRGAFLEIAGVVLNLRDPRARLSRTETRGRPISALGEFCWYMSGSDALDDIDYYISEYQKEAVDGILPGAYGPRLVGERDGGQLGEVIRLLREHPTSRRGVVRLYDAGDIRREEDVPCTCTLQYLIREGKLHALTYMRSNDVYWGLPHDVFCFTLLQEFVARCLAVDLGTYKHMVGSLHLYESHRDGAARFLDEGFQSTEYPMPDMPIDNAAGGLATLLTAEGILRAESVDWGQVESMQASANPYWADLMRLLQAFRYYKDQRGAEVESMPDIERIAGRMQSSVYRPFIQRLAERLRNG